MIIFIILIKEMYFIRSLTLYRGFLSKKKKKHYIVADLVKFSAKNKKTPAKGKHHDKIQKRKKKTFNQSSTVQTFRRTKQIKSKLNTSPLTVSLNTL